LRNLFYPCQFVSKKTDKVVLYFSSGKDSVASLDLCKQYFKKIIPVYWYVYENISFQDNILEYYEDYFKVKIIRQLHPELNQNKISKVYKKINDYNRLTYGCEWIGLGIKKYDNFRANMLVYNGYQEKMKTFYPVGFFNDNDVFQYLKKRKIALQSNYEIGYRDINSFKGEVLLWVYNNYHDDYERIKKQNPKIEIELINAKRKEEERTKTIN